LADGSVAGGTAGTKSMLAGGVYNTTLPTLTNGQQAALQLDSSGKLLTDGSSVTQPVSGTVTANAGTGEFAVNLNQVLGATISATNPVFAELTNGTAAISPTNPLPVYLQDGGTSVNSYFTSSAVAAGSSVNADYTVTSAKTLHLEQIWATASGKLKLQVEIETGVATGVFNTFWVAFNSTADPNINIPMAAFPQVAAGVRVRCVLTNNDLAAMDVYSTTSGHEQ
jgi:hypothetical protein